MNSFLRVPQSSFPGLLPASDTAESVDLLGVLDQVHRGEQGITDSKNTTTGYV
jgi:hypothetical protein